MSHRGADGAAAYECTLRCLVILADTEMEEIKTAVHFWMTDRAGTVESSLKGFV